MTALALSARDRRTLVLGLVGMAAIVGFGRGLPALRRWERARVEEAAAARAELRYAAAGERLLPALRDSLRARRARAAALDSILIDATIAAEASAQLATMVTDFAEASEVKVTAVQIRQDSAMAKSPLLRVGARLSGMGDVTALSALLQNLEGGDTPFAVRELIVSQSEPAAPDTRPEILRFELLVEGLARLTPPHP